jgi:hypothetical protein
MVTATAAEPEIAAATAGPAGIAFNARDFPADAARPPDPPARPAPKGGLAAATDGTRGMTTAARRAATTRVMRARRRTRRPMGGSCWDGAPSRCPTPREWSSATARSGASRAGWSTGGRTRSTRHIGSPGRGRTGPADRHRGRGPGRPASGTGAPASGTGSLRGDRPVLPPSSLGSAPGPDRPTPHRQAGSGRPPPRIARPGSVWHPDRERAGGAGAGPRRPCRP